MYVLKSDHCQQLDQVVGIGWRLVVDVFLLLRIVRGKKE
jgi:hypothetical protein